MNILKFIIDLFTGKAGATVGGAVSTIAQGAALLAAIAPLFLWLSSNKSEVFITVTYGDLVFWIGLAVLQLLAIRLVHRAPPPQ